MTMADIQNIISDKIDSVLSTVTQLSSHQQETFHVQEVTQTRDTRPQIYPRPSDSYRPISNASPYSCHCQDKPSKTQHTARGARRFWFSWSSHTEHLPSCPFYSASHKSTIASIGFRTSRRRRHNFVFDMAMKWTNGGISHIISYQNVVTHESPTFVAMTCLNKFLREYPHSVHDATEAIHGINIVTKFILNVFRDGKAGASDTQIDGQTLLHVRLRC
jgi:hypothetical protein